jgi:hypothetical protein
MRYKYKVEGEKWGFTKTAVMKEFPFNTEADKFVTENTVWFAIAAKYKAAFINKTLRIYYRHENPQSLDTVGTKKYPAGFVFYYQEIINKYMERMYLSPADTMRLYKNLIKYAVYARMKIFSDVIRKIRKPYKKVFAIFCVPLGYLAVLLDRIKG